MDYKVIKIDAQNYKWLVKESLSLQSEYGRKVSMNDTIANLRRKQNEKILSFSGMWKMSEKEAEEFLASTRTGWQKWKSA